MRNPKLLLTAIVFSVAIASLPEGAWAQTGLDPRLSVHGYLTQGIARASNSPIYGLNDTTTSDYRSAALQLSFEVSPKDRLVLQVSHRRLGASPLMGFESNIEVDWAFYQRRLGPISIRAGRFPLGAGIYNEIRDVGTLLPTFRAPYQMYADGTETVDGLGISNVLSIGNWSLESSAYWGGTEYKNVFHSPAGAYAIMARNEGSIGGQLWLSTPIQGLRVGASGLTWKYAGVRETAAIASLDGEFDRFLARAEYKRIRLNAHGVWSMYAQAGVNLTNKLQVVGQYETTDLQRFKPVLLPRGENLTDGAIGINYKLSPNLVFKFEQHQARGYNFDRFTNPTGPAAKSRYGIASVSVSF